MANGGGWLVAAGGAGNGSAILIISGHPLCRSQFFARINLSSTRSRRCSVPGSGRRGIRREMADCSGPEELRESLSALLAGHGVDTQAEGDWLVFPDHPGKIQGLIFERTDVHQFASTQIDVRFSPWPGCLICESFGGLGETRESRINAALEAFASNTLHVLLKAFLDTDCHEQTNEYQTIQQGVPFKITDGNVLIRSSAACRARGRLVRRIPGAAGKAAFARRNTLDPALLRADGSPAYRAGVAAGQPRMGSRGAGCR